MATQSSKGPVFIALSDVILFSLERLEREIWNWACRSNFEMRVINHAKEKEKGIWHLELTYRSCFETRQSN
jgi:hypothetical protein